MPSFEAMLARPRDLSEQGDHTFTTITGKPAIARRPPSETEQRDAPALRATESTLLSSAAIARGRHSSSRLRNVGVVEWLWRILSVVGVVAKKKEEIWLGML